MEQELPNLEKVQGYSPSPSRPDFFDQSLRLIGGLNPLGQPNLQVVWGWDARIFRFGSDRALKYAGPFLNRFILEKWLPPEFFGSEKHWEQHRWEKSAEGQKVDLLGPYPRQGAYGMVMPLTTPTGGFIPLGSDVLLFIETMQAEFQSRTLNVYSDAKRFAQLQKQMAEQEGELQREQDKVAQEYEDYVRPREWELNKEKTIYLPN